MKSEIKVLGIFMCLLLMLSFRSGCSDNNEVNEKPKPKRHALLIYEVKAMPKSSKFSFEYHTDAQTIWSTAVYAVGDTLSFTTRKLKREFNKLRTENAALKAEIAQREKTWKDIQKKILGTLQEYN